MDQDLKICYPALRPDLYNRYLKELEDAGFTSQQAKSILSIWWDMMDWY